MAMSPSMIIGFSLKKYRRRIWEILFGILPVVLVSALVVIVASLGRSADVFIQEKILDRIEMAEGQIRLSRNGGAFDPDLLSRLPDARNYTGEDLDTLKSIDHVLSVAPQKRLLGFKAETTNLIDHKLLYINNVRAAGVDSLRPYLGKTDDFVTDEVIPIVLSRDVFTEATVDFKGVDRIEISQTEFQHKELYESKSPIVYSELLSRQQQESLVGVEFSARIGGFDPLAQIDAESTSTSTMYRPRSQESMARDLESRKQTVGRYWDYDRLSQGIVVSFRVVGFNNDEDNGSSFIPESSAIELYQGLYNLQTQARTEVAMNESEVGTIFSGWRMADDGTLTMLISDSESSRSIAQKRLLATKQTSFLDGAEFFIPGWLYQSREREGGSRLEEIKNFVFNSHVLAVSDAILILDDASHRSAVINSLLKSGFYEARQNAGIADRIRLVQASSVRIVSIMVGLLTGLSVLLLSGLTWRTVSRSPEEIGIYRALGASRRDILLFYTGYCLVQVFIGVSIGAVIGWLFLPAAADGLIKAVIQSNLISGLDLSGFYDFNGLSFYLAGSEFYRFDTQATALYLGLLLFVAILASFIPAWRASLVSPIAAIRSRD